MNLISKSEVFAENKLFATLDTTVRKVVFDNLPFLLSDTVGFIRKLPTELIESFKSTLDEVREADLLVHVVDISHPQFEEQIDVVKQTLQEIGAGDKPVYLVFNKVDAYTYVEKDEDDLTPPTRENRSLDELKQSWIARANTPCIFLSARTKANLEKFRSDLYGMVRGSMPGVIRSTISSIDNQTYTRFMTLHILSEQNTVLNKFIARIRDKRIQKDSMRFPSQHGAHRRDHGLRDFEGAQLQTVCRRDAVGRSHRRDDRRPVGRGDDPPRGASLPSGVPELLRRRSERLRVGLSQSTKDGKFTVKVEYISCGSLEGKTLLLVDPMLATGSSLVLTYNALCEKGGTPAYTHVAAVVASEQGLDYAMKNMPRKTTTIWTAVVDEG